MSIVHFVQDEIEVENDLVEDVVQKACMYIELEVEAEVEGKGAVHIFHEVFDSKLEVKTGLVAGEGVVQEVEVPSKEGAIGATEE